VARRLNVTDRGSANLLDFPNMDLELVYLERDGTRLELLWYSDPECTSTERHRPMNRVGLTHLAFRVRDLDGLCAQIEDAGGTVLPSTTTIFEHGNRGIMTIARRHPGGAHRATGWMTGVLSGTLTNG
jgi:hypothetical protein